MITLDRTYFSPNRPFISTSGMIKYKAGHQIRNPSSSTLSKTHSFSLKIIFKFLAVFFSNIKRTLGSVLAKSGLGNKNIPPKILSAIHEIRSKPGRFCLNDAFITSDAQESLEYKLKLIKSAQQSIELSANYMGGKAMTRMMKVLAQQLRRKPHLKVRIMAHPGFFKRGDKIRIKELKTEFGKRLNFLITPPKTRFDQSIRFCENHVKLVVVDEKYFITGGSSITDRLASKGDQTPIRKDGSLLEKCLAAGYRDHDIVGKGPLAKIMRVEFFNHYASWQQKLNASHKEFKSKYFPLNSAQPIAEVSAVDNEERLVKGAKMKFLLSNPDFPKNNPITKEYVRMISEAAEIAIGNLYLDPVKQLKEAIARSISRGTKMTILTNGAGGNRPNQNVLYSYIGRINYSKWLSSLEKNPGQPDNLQIYEYNVSDTVYHSKILAAKNRNGQDEAIIGSYNLGLKSHEADDEVVVVIQNHDLVNQMKEIINSDLKLSKRVSVKEASKFTQDFKTQFLGAFGATFRKLI